MRWETLDGIDLRAEFLDEEDKIKQAGTIEVVFDDGLPVGVFVDLKDGRLICFGSLETDADGCRKQLFVSVTEKENDDG